MSAVTLPKLQKYLQVVKKLTAPGFSSVLRTDSLSILRNFDSTVTQDDSRLKFRYHVPEHICVSQGRLGTRLSHNNDPKRMPLSAFCAIFDELTTLALVVEDKKTRPGVSVHLSAQFVEPTLAHHGNKIDFYVKVLKVGNAFGFTEAEAVCADSGKTICIGQHTKFLPVGSWVQDFVLGPALPLTWWFASKLKYPEGRSSLKDIDPIEDMLLIDGDKFSVSSNHCNPLGAFHGGCQAMLLEKIAFKERKHDDSQLHSMSVTYMSSAKLSSEIRFQSKNDFGSTSESKNPFLSKVTLGDSGGRRIISEGIFQFAPSSSL